MASKRPAMNPPTMETTFLIPGIHCPTCSSFLDEFLFSFRPQPLRVDTSIVSHTLTVLHPTSLPVETIATALGDVGYKVNSIFTDSDTSQPSAQASQTASDDDDDDDDYSPLEKLNRTAARWFTSIRTQSKDRDLSMENHIQHCKQCRDGDEHGPSQEQASIQEPQNSLPPVVIESTPATKLRANLTITGMTCSSCVAAVTSALLDSPWVQTANVSLITHSAVVEFSGEHNAAQLVQAVEDTGREAHLESVEPVQPVVSALANNSLPTEDGLWKASVALGGMTCSSCVGSVTSALEQLPYVHQVDVNLVTSSAVIMVKGKGHVDDVLETIEDLGYEANLDKLEQPGLALQGQDTTRQVKIKVDGLYCQHCPTRIQQALETLGDRIHIDQVSSLSDPITAVTYTPDAPKFTIRDIVKTISNADSCFSPQIYIPPTVEERAQEMHRRIRQRILCRVVLSLVIAIPTFIIGIVYMSFVPADNQGRGYLMRRRQGVPILQWCLLALSTPVYFFAADIFHRRMFRELYSLWRPGSPTPILRRFYKFGSMDMLISFGTTIAYFSSIAEVIMLAVTKTKSNDHTETYFDSVVFLTFFLLLGRLLEAYTKAKTGAAVTELGNLRPKEALLVVYSGDIGDSAASEPICQSTPTALLEINDLVKVPHGASPPYDGILLSSDSSLPNAHFSEASLTGESHPVPKLPGDDIFAGTTNCSNRPIMMRITASTSSGGSMLDRIIAAVREGQARRAPMEKFADQITTVFVPIVVILAMVTWLVWLGLGYSEAVLEMGKMSGRTGGLGFWSLRFAIAVFVIACPCGIGLAAPTALFVAGGLAARYGILAKGGGEAFQVASQVSLVVFDKTGTLTEGDGLKVGEWEYFAEEGEWKKDTVLGCVKEMEGGSTHPVAKAVATFCDDMGVHGGASKSVEEIPGKGMKGEFDLGDPSSLGSVEILVGNENLMSDFGVEITEKITSKLDSWKDQAKSVVLVAGRSASTAKSWKLLAMFGTDDPVRPEARSVLAALRKQGKDVWILSGDNQRTANAVGSRVGIKPENIIAGVLPEGKSDKIRYLQQSQGKEDGRRGRALVAMVGDGVNDSPALAVADVGIAIGSGSDVAIAAAGFVLVKSSLSTLLVLTSLSSAVFRRVKLNFAWALVYNLVALPIAAGALYPVVVNGKHTRLDPAWASLAMALSSVSVICSSLLLKTKLPLVGFRAPKMKEDDDVV